MSFADQTTWQQIRQSATAQGYYEAKARGQRSCPYVDPELQRCWFHGYDNVTTIPPEYNNAPSGQGAQDVTTSLRVPSQRRVISPDGGGGELS